MMVHNLLKDNDTSGPEASLHEACKPLFLKTDSLYQTHEFIQI